MDTPQTAQKWKWRRGLALVSVTVWMVWAYFRLRPRAVFARHGQLLPNYNAWAYNHLAYSDIVKLYQTRYLYLHLFPYIQTRIEYPVITGLFMGVTSIFNGISAYFLFTFLLLYLFALMTYFILERITPRYAIYFAVSPMLLVYGMLNWDLLGIVLMVLAWYQYHQKHWVLSSILFSLGVFAKLFPIFFLPFILAELWRNRAFKTMRKMVSAFVVTSLVINVPFMLGNFKNWAFFFTYNAGRGLGADIYANEWIHGIATSAANMFSLSVMVLTVVYLMWRVYQGGRVTQAAAYAFTVFLLVNKVYSPQYTLWLLVFAIIAEWPAWTYLMLTVSGVMDYMNSFTELHLINGGASVAGGWYTNHIFFVGVLFRYLSLMISGIGAWIGFSVKPWATHANSGSRRVM